MYSGLVFCFQTADAGEATAGILRTTAEDLDAVADQDTCR